MAADESDAAAAGKRGRPAADATIGPVDYTTSQSAYVLATAKVGAMALVVGAALIAAITLAPFVASGIGVAPQHEATVTAVKAVAGTGGSAVRDEPRPGPDRTCQTMRIDLTWGDGETGFTQRCVPFQEDPPEVGDVMQVWALPGYERVVSGSRTPQTIITIVVAIAVVAASVGGVIYWRERQALRRARREQVPTVRLVGRKDRLSLTGSRGPMGRATLRLNFDDTEHPYPPLRMQAVGVTPAAMGFEHCEMYPLRFTRRGAPAGPYILQPLDADGQVVGQMVAMGRSLRATVDI